MKNLALAILLLFATSPVSAADYANYGAVWNSMSHESKIAFVDGFGAGYGLGCVNSVGTFEKAKLNAALSECSKIIDIKLTKDVENIVIMMDYYYRKPENRVVSAITIYQYAIAKLSGKSEAVIENGLAPARKRGW